MNISILLGSVGVGLVLCGSLLIYGTSVVHRQYCIFCGQVPPCLAGTNCNIIRLEGKILNFFHKRNY